MLVAELILRDAQEIPFDLEADDIAHSLLLQAPQLLAQQMARREMERHAAVEIFVAQNPADAGEPTAARGRSTDRARW